MGRVGTPDLHELISSLSKSEKRYFKLKSQQFSNDPNYLVLFDEIAKMKVYDEQKLIRKLEEKGLAKNIPFRKKHLYGRILLALDEYYKEKMVELKILSLLSNIEITYSKGLYGHAEKLIEKGLKISKKHFKFAYELMFTKRKRDLINHLQNTKIKENMSAEMVYSIVEQLEKDEKDLIELFLIDSKSSEIYTRSTLIVRFGLFDQIESVIRETQNFRKTYVMETLPFAIQMRIRRAETIILFANNDFEGQKKVLYEALELYHDHPEMIDDAVQEYLLNVNNLLVALIQSSDLEPVTKYLNILDDFANLENSRTSKIEKIRAYAFHQYNVMKYYNTLGEYKEAHIAFNKERFELSGLDLNTYKRSQILLELCVSFLFRQKYREVIRLANETMQHYENFQTEVLSQIRVMFYISHFQRNNLEFLEQFLHSKDSRTHKWFELYEQEESFLELLINGPSDLKENDKLIEHVKTYAVKVNPHFKFYINRWIDTAVKS